MGVRDESAPLRGALQDDLHTEVRGHALADEDRSRHEVRDETRRGRLSTGEVLSLHHATDGAARPDRDDAEGSVIGERAEDAIGRWAHGLGAPVTSSFQGRSTVVIGRSPREEEALPRPAPRLQSVRGPYSPVSSPCASLPTAWRQ